MKKHPFNPLRNSLRARITLLVLTILLTSIWGLTFYVGNALRADYQRLLNEQQLTTATYLANDINQELQDRLNALTLTVGLVTPAVMVDPQLAQAALNNRLLLNGLFNGGTVLIRPDGTAIAEAGVKASRVGVNYLDVETVAIALREGKANIGQPVIGKKLSTPVFGITVPVRNSEGRIIGALAGIINLSLPNFLDGIFNTTYVPGKSYMLLVAPQKRLIVTSSDKSRSMETVPAPGVNPGIDRFIDGAEGTAILRSPAGAEVLAAVKRIPSAGWYVAMLLPTAEAYAPITTVTRNMHLAAVIVSLLASGLIWWWLRRQTQALVDTAQAMEAMADSRQPLRSLPIVWQDEIGQVLRGFNRLVETLGERDRAKVEMLDSLNEAQRLAMVGSWIWDPHADVATWSAETYRIFGRDPALPPLDFKTIRQTFTPESWAIVSAAIEKSIKEGVPYECDAELVRPDGSHCWITSRGNVERDAAGNTLRLWGTSQDITERKQDEAAVERLHTLLAEAQRIGHLGSFEYVAATRETLWSEEEYRIYGLDTTQPSPCYAEMLAKCIHPEDAALLDEAFTKAIQNNAIYELEHRIVQPDGRVRWVYDRAHPYFDGAGKLVRYVGATLDITERKAAEAELKVRNEELEQFNHAMVGRELDMLEMKKRINALSRELGREAPYDVSFAEPRPGGETP